MTKSESSITKTNIHDKLIKIWLEIEYRVFGQIDEGLRWSSWYMIAIKVYRATPASIDEDCIRGIMELL